MEKYKNPSLPISERVEDLLSRLTLEEKLAQLQCMMALGAAPQLTLGVFKHGVGEISVFGEGGTPKEVAKSHKKIIDYVMQQGAGIPPIIHAEALTGFNSIGSTIFPSAIGLGASFEPDLVKKMADIIRRQMLSSGCRQALSPVMDVARDPRWGRIGETYGEDPALNAAMSVAFTKGLQTEELKDGVAATGKHFLGYGFSDGGLNLTSNPIPERELREVYAKPFQAAITEGHLASIMNSYGILDGDMIIGSERYLTKLLREEMGFEGAVVSDYTSIRRLVDYRLQPDIPSAGLAALKAGLDVECPYPWGYRDNLLEAVEDGALDEAVIDRSVRRVLAMKFKLGLFENPYPRFDLLDKAYADPAGYEHSLLAARKSIVLLKNEGGLLPLSQKTQKIAVIGPHSDDLRLLFGCYTYPASLEMQLARSMSGMPGMNQIEEMGVVIGREIPQPRDDGFVQTEPFPGSDVLSEHPDVTAAIEKLYRGKVPTVLESIRAKAPYAAVVYAKGCDVAGRDRRLFAQAVQTAWEADVVIMAVGGKYGWGKHCTIGEGIDSYHIGLPGVQEELVKEVFAAGKPMVVVHMDARPLSSEFIAEHIPAVLECWYPGITGGRAIADVLFGDYDPAGRLPATAARHAGQVPIYSGQRIGSSYYPVGKSNYRYCEGSTKPLFYFGQGLSYTQFAYSGLSVDPTAEPDGVVRVQCKVKNIGARDGEEVVQLYVSDELASTVRPYKELAGFVRLPLKAGEEKTVTFICKTNQFALINTAMEWVVEAGEMTVRVGGSSEDLPLEGRFRITGTAPITPARRGFYAEVTVE